MNITERENPQITKMVENILLDIISENPNESLSNKSSVELVKSKIDPKYKNVDILTHVGWAFDMLHANKMVKKVGPGLWQSVDGPDPVYSERSTGYSPEGEFSNRGKNFLKNMDATSRKKFNAELASAETSVKLLKTAGYDQNQIYDALTKNESGTKFNPVAVKVMIRKHFRLSSEPELGQDKTSSDIDPSIFGIDLEK